MFKIGIKNEIVLGNSIRCYGCSVKSKHANKLKYQTQALMGAMRLAGHFSAVSSRVIGKKLHLLLSIVCIFPFNYPDARRVAPISACVFLQRVSGNLKCNKNGRAFDADFEKRANGAACHYGVLCPLARVACYGV